MRFDKVEVILKYKGKTAHRYSNEILCGRTPNIRKPVLKSRLESVHLFLEGCTQFNTLEGVWKFKPQAK